MGSKYYNRLKYILRKTQGTQTVPQRKKNAAHTATAIKILAAVS